MEPREEEGLIRPPRRALEGPPRGREALTRAAWTTALTGAVFALVIGPLAAFEIRPGRLTLLGKPFPKLLEERVGTLEDESRPPVTAKAKAPKQQPQS